MAADSSSILSFRDTVPVMRALFVVLVICIVVVAAATTATDNDDDVVDCDIMSMNEYDFAPDASLFIEFCNQFLEYQRVQYIYLVLLSRTPLKILLLKSFMVFFIFIFQIP